MSHVSLPDGGSLYYEVHGSGPPLLLVAGLSGLGRFWTPHLDALTEHFTVVIHDHRGTGASSRDPIAYSIAQMTDDVVALMNALDLDRAHFAGHSTGGAIGQQMALDHPHRVERLVLSAAWAAPDPYIRSLFELRADILQHNGMDAYGRLGALLLYPPSWTRDHGLPETSGPPSSQRDVAITLARIQALLHFDRSRDVGGIRSPTLAICARDDVVIPAYCSEDLADLIPGTQLVVEPDGGHFLPLSRPAAYREQVLPFLLGD